MCARDLALCWRHCIGLVDFFELIGKRGLVCSRQKSAKGLRPSEIRSRSQVPVPERLLCGLQGVGGLGSLTLLGSPASCSLRKGLATSALGKGGARTLSTLNLKPRAKARTGDCLQAVTGIAPCWFLSKDINFHKSWVLGVSQNPQR